MFFFAFLNFSFFCRLLSHNFKFKLSAMQMNCQLMTLLIKRDLITIHHHHHQNGFSTLYIMYYNASAWMYTVVHLFINSIISNTCIFIAHWYTWYMIVCVCVIWGVGRHFQKFITITRKKGQVITTTKITVRTRERNKELARAWKWTLEMCYSFKL